MDLEKRVIANRIKAIQGLRTSSSRDLSAVHVEILFLVFVEENITRLNLCKKIPNISEATVKRYVSELVHHFAYIKEELSDNDYRIKHLSLTDQGKELIHTEIKNIQELTKIL